MNNFSDFEATVRLLNAGAFGGSLRGHANDSFEPNCGRLMLARETGL